ncbi:MAG: YceI family protein [Proteobacteria bacterium]|uniref:YceI family protein n=1 Tax=Aquabacterium sp. TaxID=1872578 RepID=UPI0035C77268|nr:YceI family protein [Pseudomonadota bacterium]
MSSRRSLMAALATAGFVLSSFGGLSPALAATAPAAAQTLVPAKSEVTFVARQLGVPLQGRFKSFQVQSAFDPKALATSKIAFSLDLGSVALNADADRELLKPEWFSTARFPHATFQSSAIKALGGGKFEVTGKLNLKGQARDLVVPVQLTQAQGLSTATGSFVLKRLDFKVGEGDWADASIVANDVQVQFKLVLQGVPAL